MTSPVLSTRGQSNVLIMLFLMQIVYSSVFFLFALESLCVSVRKAEGPGSKPELWLYAGIRNRRTL